MSQSAIGAATKLLSCWPAGPDAWPIAAGNANCTDSSHSSTNRHPAIGLVQQTRRTGQTTSTARFPQAVEPSLDVCALSLSGGVRVPDENVPCGRQLGSGGTAIVRPPARWRMKRDQSLWPRSMSLSGLSVPHIRGESNRFDALWPASRERSSAQAGSDPRNSIGTRRQPSGQAAWRPYPARRAFG